MIVQTVTVPYKLSQRAAAHDVAKRFVETLKETGSSCRRCEALSHIAGPVFKITFVLHFDSFDASQDFWNSVPTALQPILGETAKVFNTDHETVFYYNVVASEH